MSNDRIFGYTCWLLGGADGGAGGSAAAYVAAAAAAVCREKVAGLDVWSVGSVDRSSAVPNSVSNSN